MDTLGCSFFAHSAGRVGGSAEEEALGVAGRAELCAKTHGGRRRRRRKGRRLAIDAGVGSREGGVMVLTSPLAAELGLRGTAG